MHGIDSSKLENLIKSISDHSFKKEGSKWESAIDEAGLSELEREALRKYKEDTQEEIIRKGKEEDKRKENQMEGIIEAIKVLHCRRDRSNKVYILIVLRTPDAKHEVLEFYGKRKKLATYKLLMDSKGKFDTFWTALSSLRTVFDEKVEKHHYVDVESSVYFKDEDSVSMEEVKEFLHSKGVEFAEKVGEVTTKRTKKKKESVEVSPVEEIVVVCIDNTGLEDQFDLNVEYVGRRTDSDDTLIVENKFGEEKECFAHRFKVIHDTAVS